MAKIVEDAILIYTDGSLYPKGRKGGYGIVFVHVSRIGEETVVESHSPPGVRGTTNNRMELQACIDGLKMVSGLACFNEVSRCVVRTDSQYVVKYFPLARSAWRKNGWKNANGRPVDNADLWKDLIRESGKVRKPLNFEKVKAHQKGKAKDIYNDAADKLAKLSANNPLSKSVFRSSVRRKLSPNKTSLGSVEMRGQTMTIRVIETQWLRIQKTWKYRYEVISESSPFFECVDWIYASNQLRDGHSYEVRVNEDSGHPQLVELLREIEKVNSSGVRSVIS